MKKAIFDFEFMSNEEEVFVCFNKKKYTKEQALELGKKELEKASLCYETKINTGFVRYEIGCWNMRSFGFTEYGLKYFDKKDDDVEVWVVTGYEE